MYKEIQASGKHPGSEQTIIAINSFQVKITTRSRCTPTNSTKLGPLHSSQCVSTLSDRTGDQTATFQGNPPLPLMRPTILPSQSLSGLWILSLSDTNLYDAETALLSNIHDTTLQSVRNVTAKSFSCPKSRSSTYMSNILRNSVEEMAITSLADVENIISHL